MRKKVLWEAYRRILILLCAFILFPASCFSETIPEEKHVCRIKFEVKNNLFFSKYDVEVYIDQEKIGKMKNGSKKNLAKSLPEGDHVITVYKENDHAVKGEYKFELDGYSHISISMKSHKDHIDLEATEKNRYDIIADSGVNEHLKKYDAVVSRLFSGYDHAFYMKNGRSVHKHYILLDLNTRRALYFVVKPHAETGEKVETIEGKYNGNLKDKHVWITWADGTTRVLDFRKRNYKDYSIISFDEACSALMEHNYVEQYYEKLYILKRVSKQVFDTLFERYDNEVMWVY